jgi:hypothetical protein
MTNNEVLSLDEIKEALKHRRLYIVAQSTGLSYPTIKKLADGKELNYTIQTLIAVSKYLKESSTLL